MPIGEPGFVPSDGLEHVLREFISACSELLAADVGAGEEVPFELVARTSSRMRPALYCYEPLVGPFMRERTARLSALPSHAAAVAALERAGGLERYLLARGAARAPVDQRERAGAVLRALLDEVFAGSTDFALREERVSGALRALHELGERGIQGIVVLAGVHGMAVGSPAVPLAPGLTLAQPGTLGAVPEELAAERPGALVRLELEESSESSLQQGCELLAELQRALRLFGDARIALAPLAWARVEGSPWRALPLSGAQPTPRGILVVAPDQEDELRAFCSLVGRRAGRHPELSWALERFESGAARGGTLQALSDYLLGLRALLEPEGPASGLLPGRLAALCATPERRLALVDRARAAVELERAAMGGRAEDRGEDALTVAMGEHLRALLRDVLCGHLDPDLPVLADELLLGPEEEPLTGAEPDLEATLGAGAGIAAQDTVAVRAPLEATGTTTIAAARRS